MNEHLRHKTDDELWQIFQNLKLFPNGTVVNSARYDILSELERREKETK